MKTIVHVAAVWMAALIGCGPAVATAQVQTDPTTLVKKYYAAFNAGQLDTAMSFLSKDPLLTSPEGRFKGRDASRMYLKSLIDRGLRQEISNFRESKGEVRYDYKWLIGPTQVGGGNEGLTIVKDGKIVFDGYEKDKP